MYVVTAYRWGDRERHSYVVAVTDTPDHAEMIAHQEEHYRGGKYSCGIVRRSVELRPDGVGASLMLAIRHPALNPAVRRPGAAISDELRETLLWYWAANSRPHMAGFTCDDLNGVPLRPGDIPCSMCAETADMREAASVRVDELMRGGDLWPKP